MSAGNPRTHGFVSNLMRRIKFAVVLALLALMAALGFYQSDNVSYSSLGKNDHHHRAKFTFLVEGNIDNGRYTSAMIGDTLQHYLTTIGPIDPGATRWGIDLLEREPAPGITLHGSIENFRFWGELEFPGRTDRFEWMEKVFFSPNVKRIPAPTADGTPCGLLALHLPMVDGSGRWLHLEGLRYQYFMS